MFIAGQLRSDFFEKFLTRTAASAGSVGTSSRLRDSHFDFRPRAAHTCWVEYQQTTPGAPVQKGYGKRPLWQWILLYVIVGGILYYGIYYFAIAKKGGYTTTNVNGVVTNTYTNTSSGGLY